jgi:5-methyltetrahydrofolate--homocysteine methyltransferase
LEDSQPPLGSGGCSQSRCHAATPGKHFSLTHEAFMTIDFSPQRWQSIKHTYGRWWAGELDRPLIYAPLNLRTPQRAKPDIPWHWFNSFYDLSVPAEKIVDWYEYNLEELSFLGDSYPHANPYFGPGVLAAFLGAQVTNSISVGTTWFHPKTIVPAREISLRFDPASPWWLRIVDLYRTAQRRFQGQVQLDMTDLGGNLDIASTFRPNEHLLLDLYDCPEDVTRLAWETHTAWWQAFEGLSREANLNPGYTAWCPIFSEDPYYMLQCDFCYMIGPKQFETFVLPELAATCRKLKNPFYHLDGPGQLAHLDALLSIPELKGIQWVPGSGQPDVTQWPEVYRKIRAAGKLIQVYTRQSEHRWKVLDILADQLGSAKGIILIGGGGPKDEEPALGLLEKYGCPVS